MLKITLLICSKEDYIADQFQYQMQLCNFGSWILVFTEYCKHYTVIYCHACYFGFVTKLHHGVGVVEFIVCYYYTMVYV